MLVRPSAGRTLFIILVLSTLTVCAFLGAAEGYRRLTVPFNVGDKPIEFDPRVGTIFQAGGVVRSTNGVDFWQTTTANSLGFLDREPPSKKAGERCRVLFIGDSFVAATQVPIETKFHVLLEGLARERLPALKIETLAFGYSGTGQANQLPYYEVFGAPLRPDVVVLVVVGNDFANNSPLLQAVRHGWHPAHPPRLFLRKGPEGARRLPIDPHWQQYRLARPADEAYTLHKILLKSSYFYHWMFRHLLAEMPRVAELLSGQSQAKAWPGRMRKIEDIDGFENVFAGWRYPDDLDMNAMFYSDGPLPPVFEEALSLTGDALDEFRRHAREVGFHLVVLATDGLSGRFAAGAERFGRTMHDRGPLARLQEMTDARDLDLVDQRAYLLSQGGSPRQAHFHRDGHWSRQGHQWAAGAMLEYFLAKPEICSRAG